MFLALFLWFTSPLQEDLSTSLSVLSPTELVQEAQALSLPNFDHFLFSEPVVQPSISSHFGMRRHPVTRKRRLHKGMDFKGKRGTQVKASAFGTVRFAGRRSSYGKLVVVDHGFGVETRYAHLNSIKVREGQWVSPEDSIGTIGSTGRSTGPHLHFEVRVDDTPVNPKEAFGATPIQVATL